jgi:hypothetical protein
VHSVNHNVLGSLSSVESFVDMIQSNEWPMEITFLCNCVNSQQEPTVLESDAEIRKVLGIEPYHRC